MDVFGLTTRLVFQFLVTDQNNLENGLMSFTDFMAEYMQAICVDHPRVLLLLQAGSSFLDEGATS